MAQRGDPVARDPRPRPSIPPGRRLVVVGGARTPFAKSGTRLRALSASDLGTIAVREALARGPVDPGEVDEVLLGCVGPDAREANPARVIALRAGLPRRVPAATTNRNCASGMESILAAARRIALGEADVCVVGGTESMSRYPLSFGPEATEMFERLARARSAGQRIAAASRFRPRFLKPRVALLEGLTDPTCGLDMGQTAEVLAREWAVSREEQDRFALRSHQCATAAEAAGILAEEIVPVFLDPRSDRGAGARDERTRGAVERDEGIRRDQTIEQLAKLRPFFDRTNGTVTVGNSCPVTDGAAALVVASEERARSEGWPVLGTLRGWAVAGLDPERMGLGPAYALAPLLVREGLRLADLDALEINEAFAAQVIACLRAMRDERFCREQLSLAEPLGAIDEERLDRNGGAIALGHPVGATGARLALTLLLSLRRRGERLGVATLCVGGGQGVALLFERVPA